MAWARNPAAHPLGVSGTASAGMDASYLDAFIAGVSGTVGVGSIIWNPAANPIGVSGTATAGTTLPNVLMITALQTLSSSTRRVRSLGA